MKFKATVENGIAKLENKEHFKEVLDTFEGKDITIDIQKYRKPRSNAENRYYRGVVLKILSNHTGYEEAEMHAILGDKYLRTELDGHGYVRSTASLSTVEFEEYMSKCRMFSSKELNCYVPKPNEAYLDSKMYLYNF